MPKIIQHIDAIARQKERDVLYIVFDKAFFSDENYEQCVIRNKLILWLTEQNIHHHECANFADENLIEPYQGQIYIDVPYDESDSTYIKVKNHLENSDGNPRIKGVIFYLVPLKLALKNKHHDEPDFWEKWAEDF